MFDRRKYKKFALIQLKKRWSVPVVMTIVCAVILILLSLPDFQDYYTTYLAMTNLSVPGTTPPTDVLHDTLSFLAVLVQFVIVFAQIHVYLKLSRSPEPVAFGDFVDGFNLWARAILSGLWETLWVFLWSLLFLFPGIVKHYAYSQMKFLVAEYKNLSVTKAMRVSIAITRGHKAELFVTDLSFVGWGLLCCLTGGIGFFWLVPYYSMTFTNVYHALLKEAVSSGIITAKDLEG